MCCGDVDVIAVQHLQTFDGMDFISVTHLSVKVAHHFRQECINSICRFALLI